MSSNEENEQTEKTRRHKDKSENEEKRRRRKKKKDRHENNPEDTKQEEEKTIRRNSDDDKNDEGKEKVMRASRHIRRRESQENKEDKHRVVVNLWHLAVEQMQTKDKNRTFVKESQSVVFLGSKGSGKSTLLTKCLGRSEDNLKATIGLDYTFVRKSKQEESGGEPGHVWEIGGGVRLARLLAHLINAHTLRNTLVVMVLDVSQPATLWLSVEKWLEALRSRVNDVITKDENSASMRRELEEKAQKAYKDHVDSSLLDLQLVPLLLVANKYDVLQDMEGEERRLICKTLRFICHRSGAHLQFCSATKMESLVGKVKSFMDHHFFHSPLDVPVQTAHNKPLSITAGQDSFQEIGMPSIPDGDTGRLNAKTPFELWKYAFNKMFPQKDLNKLMDEEDATQDPQYREPEIDSMKMNKDQELQRYMTAQEGKSLHFF